MITYIMLYKESQAEPFYELAAEYGVKRSDVGIPFMIVGKKVLIGTDEIKKNLPDLIQDGINHGGIPFPERVLHSEFAKDIDIKTIKSENFVGESFAIFTVISLLIFASYSLLSLKFTTLTKYLSFIRVFRNYLIFLLIFVGFLISIYLLHLETTSSSGVCIIFSGCNIVQKSSFSRIFGIIPVALLEIFVFFVLFALWIYSCKLKRDKIFFFNSRMILFWINFVAVVVAISLTVLEIFVIKSACIYCLISSIILGLLLILFNPNFDRINTTN
ncbi:vitamin K epoxide reductase family protein [Thermodesulfobium narugense]|uniref:vitamin K epoxide reductase family protein n=1 Tax=Thermodesulfobium narugense TaxID=184064 RepID=UPI00145D247E|nr:vitamin K epoxide reductase family protein [Thermodesulfobium narugense]